MPNALPPDLHQFETDDEREYFEDYWLAHAVAWRTTHLGLDRGVIARLRSGNVKIRLGLGVWDYGIDVSVTAEEWAAFRDAVDALFAGEEAKR